jgi:hypothetical protein
MVGLVNARYFLAPDDEGYLEGESLMKWWMDELCGRAVRFASRAW